MLETVREFGRMRLADAGEEAAARAAQRQWAAAYARHHGARLPGRDQFAAVDALAAEEVNLADELRAAIADGDRGSLVQLLAALGLFWTVRGEHVAADRAGRRRSRDALRRLAAAAELADDARAAVMITLSNSLMTTAASGGPLRAILLRLSEDAGRQPAPVRADAGPAGV